MNFYFLIFLKPRSDAQLKLTIFINFFNKFALKVSELLSNNILARNNIYIKQIIGI